MQSGPKKQKLAALNNQPDDKGKVVSIMYLRKGNKEDVLLIPKNVAQLMMSLMQKRRYAPRLGILMPLSLAR